MRGMNAGNGTPLAGDGHLLQSVTDILQTPVGSRVLRRDYGSDLPRLVDNPQDNATRARVVAATATALNRWEPRLRVTAVSVSYTDAGTFSLTLAGQRRDDGREMTLPGITVT